LSSSFSAGIAIPNFMERLLLDGVSSQPLLSTQSGGKFNCPGRGVRRGCPPGCPRTRAEVMKMQQSDAGRIFG
jgi:hypothetical protein